MLVFVVCCISYVAVDLNGLNYGPASLGNDIFVTYGVNGTELRAPDCFIIEDHVRIRCKTIPAAGEKLVWGCQALAQKGEWWQ